MYLAGVSVRRVEDITEALWGTRVSPSTVSDLNKKIYESTRAHPPRDQATHSGRRLVSGRAIGAQPRRGQAPAHRRHRVVD